MLKGSIFKKADSDTQGYDFKYIELQIRKKTPQYR